MTDEQIFAEFRQMFAEVTEDCLLVLQKHIVKGDSWKTCDINFLQRKVIEEFEEWRLDAENRCNDQRELLDLINMCVMLLKRHERDERSK